MRAATFFYTLGVPSNDTDAIERYSKPLADALGETRFVTLAAWRGANYYFNSAFRQNIDLCPFNWGSARDL